MTRRPSLMSYLHLISMVLICDRVTLSTLEINDVYYVSYFKSYPSVWVRLWTIPYFSITVSLLLESGFCGISLFFLFWSDTKLHCSYRFISHYAIIISKKYFLANCFFLNVFLYLKCFFEPSVISTIFFF